MQKCPHCGSANVRKSRRYKAERTLLRPFPAWFRCRECRKRFVGTDWPLARRWAAGAAAVVGVMWLGAVVWPEGGQPGGQPTPAPGTTESVPAAAHLPALDVELTGEALRAAAERGDPEAQHRLGLELLQTFREEGDPAVLAEAVHLLKEAAGRGNPRSQLVLGALYENGRGVIQDFREAAGWYRRAAENGEADAMLRLGLMAEAGRGMDRDLVEAYVWLNLAAARGATEAEIRREAVRRQLTLQQVARGQDRCRALDTRIPPLPPR
ncbi:tetratricopeptide repeat protein [Deferrisoma camini]|uniref:tetratricopeptide repeat protein n=1 Tax=Deferrisoma camini TaxID=1035120 RepID=UPI00046CC0A1|nr:tetratricopeptide repeat protein [Deferrisoma camini]